MHLQADSEDLSDWVDAQADQSIGWEYRSFCIFCRVGAHTDPEYLDRQV